MIRVLGNEVIQLDDSILNTIREMLGPDSGDDAFSTDLIVHINTYLGRLNQLGVGKKGFRIQDETATWSEFLDGFEDFDSVKSYVYIKVKQIFDTSASSTIVQVLKEEANEIEWRLIAEVDLKEA